MKKTWMLCLIGVLLLAGAARSQAQINGGTEKAVAALEEQWLQAQKTNNADLLAPLLADKFVNTGSDGKVTGRAETLGELKTMKWNSADYADLKGTVFGDTAIAAGGCKGNGTDATGKAFELGILWGGTRVTIANWKWELIASQR